MSVRCGLPAELICIAHPSRLPGPAEQISLNDHENQPNDPTQGTSELKPELPKIISFTSLARCGDEVWIETGGQVYRLRKTRQGKLILTK